VKPVAKAGPGEPTRASVTVRPMADNMILDSNSRSQVLLDSSLGIWSASVVPPDIGLVGIVSVNALKVEVVPADTGPAA
jgi:hypothetical protein